MKAAATPASPPSDHPSFGYVFPAIRGVQAGREYYASMCPLRIMSKLFTFDDEEVPPELRAQRSLNRGRIPEIARYITENEDNYCFSAITASVDSTVRFEPLGEDGESSRVGRLHIPLEARFIINDGQHRRAAIEQAVADNHRLGNESIAVVFFIDHGLARCQQMFADLNRHVVRPSKSIGVLYDHRDDKAALTREMIFKSEFFQPLVDLEATSLSKRSKKLFTLSAMYQANCLLLDDLGMSDREQSVATCKLWWEAVAEHMTDWKQVHRHEATAADVRKQKIHTAATTLGALGQVGNALLRERRDAEDQKWEKRLRPLAKISWLKTAPQWQGRAIVRGQMRKGNDNMHLIAIAIKQELKLKLSPEDRQAEDRFQAASR